MSHKTALQLFLGLYMLLQAVTGTVFTGVGGSASLRNSLLFASVAVICYVYAHINKTSLDQAERRFFTLGFIACEILYRIFLTLVVAIKTHGENLHVNALLGVLLVTLLNAINITVAVYLCGWVLSRFPVGERLMVQTPTLSTTRIAKQLALSKKELAEAETVKNQSSADAVNRSCVVIIQKLISVFHGQEKSPRASLCTALGALMGYACQAALRETLINTGKLTEQQVFSVIEDKNGQRYFFGDALNALLAESEVSVWSILSNGAAKAGVSPLPDKNKFFERTSKSVGGKTFGVPQVPSRFAAAQLPIDYLRALWPATRELLDHYCESPQHRPLLLAAATVQLMHAAKQDIPPAEFLKIVMESAVPMSKVDLQIA